MKWAVLGIDITESRYLKLSEEMKRQGKDNEVSFVSIAEDASKKEAKEILEKLKQDCDCIRFTYSVCDLLVRVLDSAPSVTYSMGAGDFYIKTKGSWWLRSSLYEGLSTFMSTKPCNINLSEAVFVVGTNWAARVAVAVFAKVGYKKIKVTDLFNERGMAFVQDLKKRYFSLDIEFIPVDALTMMTGECQIFLNAVDELEVKTRDGLIAELSYFNYMSKEGLILDCHLAGKKQKGESVLIEEAITVDAMSVPHTEILSWMDDAWLSFVTEEHLGC